MCQRHFTTSRDHTTEFAIGVTLAASVGLFAGLVGFDRERSFYPAVLIVIASHYLLFGAMASSMRAVFVAAAALGFRKSPWIVVGGLALHGVFHFVHPAVVTNPGVPAWWPGFCLAYDPSAAVYLAALIRIRRDWLAA